MTANPLSCIKSNPVLDFKFPVDKKDSKLLPIIPFYKSFLIFYIAINLVSNIFAATASFMILALTYDKVYSNFYLNIIR